MEKIVQVIIILVISSLPLFAQSYSGGSGTSGDPYLIENKADLKYLSENFGEWSKHFKQTADIIFSLADFQLGGDFYNGGNGFIPIGNSSTNFTGSYEGNGHSITGLYISRPGSSLIGMFGYCSGAELKDLGLIDVNILGDEFIGGLVGDNFSFSTINNCYSTGSVRGSSYIGGLVGNNAGIISNSYSTALVNTLGGGGDFGGLAGSNYGTISNSYSTSSVNGGLGEVGGLVGINGYNHTINNSYSTGSASGYNAIGGLVGLSESNTNINNSYSIASVNGSSNVGGLVGYSEAAIVNSYSTGSVSGSTSVGGLVGDNYSGTITNSFWDMETSGQSSSSGGTGKTTAEMTTNAQTYPNFYTDAEWDFNGESINGTHDYWNINSTRNNGYPFLTWQYPSDAPLPVELTSFTAKVLDESVQLNWQTATEVNNYEFEIQRKIRDQKSEVSHWEKIGFVQGNGNSNSPRSYSFVDNNLPTANELYYRLKQIDNDGKFKYSDIIEVQLSKPLKFSLEQNYPNPFNPTTIIKYSVPESIVGNENFRSVHLIVYDLLGREVATLVNEEKQPGTYQAEFNRASLSSGIYYYQLRVNTLGSNSKQVFVSTKKFVLLK